MSKKTNGFYVYAHITPTGLFYIGTSGMQPSKRWSPSLYKETALYEYIQKFGWENIRHFIFKDGLTREQAYQLEGLLIQEATDKGYCINKQRSGLIKVSDVNAYAKQYYTENEQYREKRKVNQKQLYTENEDYRERKKARMKQYYSEHREESKAKMKQYDKQRLSTPEGKIYNRVAAYNQNHTPIETPLEAKQKYLENGYIPSYIKNNDLNNN